MQYGFAIDNRKCIGCHACTVACKSEHQTPVGVNRTWVKYIEKGTFPDTRRLFSVMRCNHCANAPCVEICPVSALFTRKDGIVDFDNRRCIGCKACTQACPYDAIYIDPASHTAAKCNYCAHRIEVNLEPACVNVCPEEAIISGDLDDPNSKISKLLAREQVTVRKPEKGTEPKLFYIDGDEASLQPTRAEPSTGYMFSSQATGVGHHSQGTSAVAGPQTAIPVASSNVKWTGEPVKRAYDPPSKGVLWGWEVSAYLWTKGLACGAFMVPALAAWIPGVTAVTSLETVGVVVAMIFMAITGALLIKDLDRPDRFLYVLLRPQWKSWLTRGAYLIAVFTALLVIRLGASLVGADGVIRALRVPTLVFAAGTAVYTALLLAQAKGRDFWQSPLLAPHMLVQSLVAGAALFLLLPAMGGVSGPWDPYLRIMAGGGTVVSALLLLAELGTPHPTKDGEAVVRMLLKERYATAFWVGVVTVGHGIPVTLLLVPGSLAGGAAALALLTGLAVTEHLWVRAPQQIPLS